MSKDDPFHKTPDDFDPDQTLFFQRRRQNIKLLPLIVTCVLLLGSGALLVWAFNQPERNGADHAVTIQNSRERPAIAVEQTRSLPSLPSSLPTASSTSAAAPRVAAVGNSVPFDETKPVRAALPVDPSISSSSTDAGGDSPPAIPADNAPLNLDVNDPNNAQVRTEVLRRIDLMPGVSATNKDKLYASVDHARGMGRVMTIPFTKGETTVRPADVDHLKALLASPSVHATMDDPTAVLVVLGYADPKGNDKVNSDLSLSRARCILDALRDKCEVQNVMHAVAMGGSTLFGTDKVEKNRVVEVWAVLP